MAILGKILKQFTKKTVYKYLRMIRKSQYRFFRKKNAKSL